MINNKARFKSLFLFYFKWYGKYDNLEVASNRAYLDLCRTLKWISKKLEKNNINKKKKVAELIEKELINLVTSSKQSEFNEKHSSICNNIIDIYNGYYNDFTFWHAQKWLNMTLKYLFILDLENIYNLDRVYKFCHVPIDSIILKELKNKRIISDKDISKVWSKMSEEEYNILLNKIYNREIDRDKFMLDLDFDLWKKNI